MAMRSDLLTNILKELNNVSADIDASAIISSDGLVMSSLLPATMQEDRVGAMSAAILALGSRTSTELARGKLEQVLVKGADGYVLMIGAGNDAVLTVLASANAKLGLIFLDVRRAAEAVAKVV